MKALIEEVTFFEQEQLIGIKYKYSVNETNPSFITNSKNLGFKYIKDKGFVCAPASSGIVYYTNLHLSKNAKLTNSYMKYLETIKNELKVYEYKTGLRDASEYNDNDLKLKPRPHQIAGYEITKLNKGKVIINDTPGTGKTLQALMYTVELGEPVLVLCPNSLVDNWEVEISKSILDPEKRFMYKIVGYNYLGDKEIKDLIKEKYNHFIIDECHNLSKVSSKKFKTVRKITKNSKTNILITGKAMDSDPMAFYAYASILGKDIKKKSFTSRFFNTSYNGKFVEIGEAKLDRLKMYFAPLTVCRGFSEIEDFESRINKIMLKMSGSNNPDLATYISGIEENLDKLAPSDVIALNKLASKIKVELAIKVTQNVIKENPRDRIVIASQFKDHLDLIASKIPGSKEALFMNNESSVILLDTSKMREGINLEKYNHMIILDRYFDMAKNKQVEGRIKRISSTKKSCQIYHIETDLVDSFIDNMPVAAGHKVWNKIMKKKLSEQLKYLKK